MIGSYLIILVMAVVLLIPANALADEYPYLFNRYYTEPPKFCLIENPLYSDELDKYYNKFVTGMKNWEALLSVYPGTWDMKAYKVDEMKPWCTVKVEFTTEPIDCGDNLVQGCASSNWIGMRIFSPQNSEYFIIASSHEVGHTMGIDHYETDSPFKKAQWLKDREWPSIMFSGGMAVITALDISKIVSLYQATEDKPENGFWHFGNRPVETPPIVQPPIIQPPTVQPPTVQPPVVVAPPPLLFSPVADMHICTKDVNGKDDCSKNSLEVLRGAHYVPTIVLISGFLNEENFVRGLPIWITITEPPIVVKRSDGYGNEFEIIDYPTQIHKIKPTKERYFELPILIDHVWALGSYKIQVTYQDNTNSEKNVFFQLVDKKTSTEKEENFAESNYQVVKNEIPKWFSQNTEWWLDGQIDEATYLVGITSLIDLGLIEIPQQILLKNKQVNEELSAMNIDAEYNPSHEPVPKWFKNTGKWWAEGTIDDRDYLLAVEYLIKQNIIKLEY